MVIIDKVVAVRFKPGGDGIVNLVIVVVKMVVMVKNTKAAVVVSQWKIYSDCGDYNNGKGRGREKKWKTGKRRGKGDKWLR